jgi:N-acyl-D-amino-acid deacylase
MALDRHLKMFFITPTNNEDQDTVLSMLLHPSAAVTFSDSGAHVASTVNPVQTHLLGYWVRERGAISLEAAVKKITSDIANFWGLRGRGLLREGHAADMVVFDPETIAPAMPELVRDLPTGASRILQKATGIETTIVNGQVLLRDGEHMGAFPGRVLRGPLTAG